MVDLLVVKKTLFYRWSIGFLVSLFCYSPATQAIMAIQMITLAVAFFSYWLFFHYLVQKHCFFTISKQFYRGRFGFHGVLVQSTMVEMFYKKWLTFHHLLIAVQR